MRRGDLCKLKRSLLCFQSPSTRHPKSRFVVTGVAKRVDGNAPSRQPSRHRWRPPRPNGRLCGKVFLEEEKQKRPYTRIEGMETANRTERLHGKAKGKSLRKNDENNLAIGRWPWTAADATAPWSTAGATISWRLRIQTCHGVLSMHSCHGALCMQSCHAVLCQLPRSGRSFYRAGL